MPVLNFIGFQCYRCLHQWVPAKLIQSGMSFNKPRVCPGCKSPYWDQIRESFLYDYINMLDSGYRLAAAVFVKSHIKAGHDSKLILECIQELGSVDKQQNPKLFLEKEFVNAKQNKKLLQEKSTS